MSRPLIAIALLLAVIGVIFFFAKLAVDFLTILALGAIVLIAVGILTGD